MKADNLRFFLSFSLTSTLTLVLSILGKGAAMDVTGSSRRDDAVGAAAVGGTTTHWAGASLRFQEHEFKTRTVYGDVKDANLLDWPLTLADLEPYYARAEDKMGVTRTNGIPGLPGNNNFKVLEKGALALGYKEVHTGNMAINSRPRHDRGRCMQLGFCFQGCKSGAKWSTLYTELPKAESTGNLDLRPESHVSKIEHDDKGKVTGVVYFDKAGKEQRQKARIVCVAGNSIESPRLLLNSASSKFPDGLANSSGQVGKNYMRHTTGSVYASFEKPVHMYRGTTMAGIIRDEAAHNPKRGFVGGYELMDNDALMHGEQRCGISFAIRIGDHFVQPPGQKAQAAHAKTLIVIAKEQDGRLARPASAFGNAVQPLQPQLPPDRAAHRLPVERAAFPGKVEQQVGHVVDHCRQLQMAVSGIGKARRDGGLRLRLRAPGGQAGRGRPVQEEGAADARLYLLLDLRPQTIDDPAHVADAGGASFDRFQIVADRLFARDFGERAKDRREEARKFRLVPADLARAQREVALVALLALLDLGDLHQGHRLLGHDMAVGGGDVDPAVAGEVGLPHDLHLDVLLAFVDGEREGLVALVDAKP